MTVLHQAIELFPENQAHRLDEVSSISRFFDASLL